MRKHTKWSLIETKYLVIWIMWFFLIIYAIMKYQKLKRNLYTACVVANLFLIPSPVLWAEQSYAQSTRLSLELSNATISDVFASVEKNSEYRFFYSDAVRAELYRNVDVNIKNKTIDRILSEVLDGKRKKRSKRKKYQSTELSEMPNRNLCPESTYWSKVRLSVRRRISMEIILSAFPIRMQC